MIENPDRVILAYHLGPHMNYITHDSLFGTENLRRLRIIVSKIKIKDSVLNKINSNINERTLGIHVRLTDMAQYHPELHRGTTTNDYLIKINEVLSNNHFDEIFISSDNYQSLEKIKSTYPNLLYNDVNNRNIDESPNNYDIYMANQMHLESFWIDSFLEMLSLSRCGTLIYNSSNLNNTSIIFSKNIQKSYKIWVNKE